MTKKNHLRLKKACACLNKPITGTHAKHVAHVLMNLGYMWDLYPLFVDHPKFNKNRRYMIITDDETDNLWRVVRA